MARKPIVKFGKILPHLCFLDNVRIYDTGCGDPDSEPIFEGSIMDVPWSLMEWYLDSDENGESISAHRIINEYGVETGLFVIGLREEYNA